MGLELADGTVTPFRVVRLIKTSLRKAVRWPGSICSWHIRRPIPEQVECWVECGRAIRDSNWLIELRVRGARVECERHQGEDMNHIGKGCDFVGILPWGSVASGKDSYTAGKECWSSLTFWTPRRGLDIPF